MFQVRAEQRVIKQQHLTINHFYLWSFVAHYSGFYFWFSLFILSYFFLLEGKIYYASEVVIIII